MRTTQLPYVVALCPTFRHPVLLANSVALWNLQDYPAEHRLLIICDDDGQFTTQAPELINVQDSRWSLQSWMLYSHPTRFPSITAKYNYLLDKACEDDTPSIFLVWEDDDIYLPTYVSDHVKALEQADLSKPVVVLSDYNYPTTGALVAEGSAGRFHSSLAFRRELIERVGGWPDTKRADFDQQLIRLLHTECRQAASPWPSHTVPSKISYVYRWHSGAMHGQSTMRSPDDETWYDKAYETHPKPEFIGSLRPKLDSFSSTLWLKP